MRNSMVQRATPVIAGVVLLAGACYGAWYSARAAEAHTKYHTAKYGSAKEDIKEILELSEQAHSMYPHNYYLCIWAAEKAYYSSLTADKNEEQAQTLLAVSEKWCDKGLALNQYKSQLRLLKTHLLEKNSLPDAIKYWESYVDWQFWSPYNHAVLAELYAKNGDFEKAVESLRLVRGSEYYAATIAKIKEEWNKDMTLPLRSPSRQLR